MVEEWIDVFEVDHRSIHLQRPDRIAVIAEVGINHNGDMALAKKLIDVAADAGCDAVKFQKRTIDVVYSRAVLDSPRESPWGTTQRDQKEGLEFNLEEYEEIDRYCAERAIDWSASAWDLESLYFLERFDPPFHKVASALISHEEFVRSVATLGRPTLVSTGMASLDMVDKVVEVFQRAGTPFALLHTVSTYPSPEDDLNLLAIPALRARYGVTVGYSGHEPSVSPSVVAAALGAGIIERHITVDRSMYGSDQAASLEEAGLRQLVGTLHKLQGMLGTGEKDWAPGEQEVARKLRYWEEP